MGEAVSMLTDVDEVGFTNLERQSAALFLAPEIHSKVIFYVGKFQTPSVDLVVSICTIWGIKLAAYDHFNRDVGTLQVVVPLSNGIVNSICLLLCCALFSLSLSESVRQKSHRKFCAIMFLESCAPHASSEASVYTMYF